MSQDSALEVLAKIALHIARDRVIIGVRLPMGTKPGLQMLLHHLTGDRLLRASSPIEAAWRRRIVRYGIEKESRCGYSIGIN